LPGQQLLPRPGIFFWSLPVRDKSFTPEQDVQLRQEHEAGLSATKLAVKWGAARSTVVAAIQRAGGALQCSQPRGKRSHRRLSPATEAEICRLYRAGGEPDGIAARFGIHRETVRPVLRRNGIAMRATPLFKIAVTPEQSRAILARYDAEQGPQAIANALGVTLDAVLGVLKRAGVPRRMFRAPSLTSAVHRAICESIVGGAFIREAAARAGVCKFSVLLWLRLGRREASGRHRNFYEDYSRARAAAKAASPGKRRSGARAFLHGRSVSIYDCRQDAFSDIITEAQAYFLGWLATDGCVRGNVVSLCLQRRDRALVESFRAFLGSDAPIHTILCKATVIRGRPVRESWQAHFEATCPLLVADLKALGIVENKTFVIRPWDGPAHLMRHWWRGCVEGDGWVRRARPRASGGYHYDIGLCGTRAMVEGFRDFVTAAGGRCPRVTPIENIWAVRFIGTASPKFVARLLYEGATLTLERKRLVAEELLRTEVLRRNGMR
jgi:hypothetical protein